jgi:hypothetical protein
VLSDGIAVWHFWHGTPYSWLKIGSASVRAQSASEKASAPNQNGQLAKDDKANLKTKLGDPN